MAKKTLSRRDFLKRSGWAAGAITLGSSSAVLWDIACGPAREKRGNTLVELIPASPELNPLMAKDNLSSRVIDKIFDGLLEFDQELNLAGELAESFQLSEDYCQITFRLRDNLWWHDGKQVTAADAFFTYQLLVNEKTPFVLNEGFKKIKKAEVVDNLTFRVNYEEPYAAALNDWTIPILPSHLLSDNFFTAKFGESPIGEGPYIFESLKEDEEIVLRSNPRYYKGAPRIEKLILKIRPNATFNYESVAVKKEADLAEIGFSKMKSLLKEGVEVSKKLNLFQYRRPDFSFLAFNLQDELLKDIKVRQAISYAIDKASLVKYVLEGYGDICYSPYLWERWYNPEILKYEQNPSKTEELLAEAGWSRGADGYLERNGKKFSLTLSTNTGSTVRLQSSQIIQEQLKKVGIEVKLNLLEPTTFNDYIINKRFQLALLGFICGVNPDDQYFYWHSNEGLNIFSFHNDEVDRLMEESSRTLDQRKRREYHFRIQRLLSEELPMLPLFVRHAIIGVSKRIKGIEEPLQVIPGEGFDHDIYRWYIEG
ncbi:MAG: ABC transporter substrate-binding protein [Candidatus Aminicenantes bacterium]|nr:ABC transporter substrate-binding protein [Candidatus Aminicenantes bacterium]MDH5714097.1 ABC transporter substrate-binding protein [Candidatus Aminicenantes bacterium]